MAIQQVKAQINGTWYTLALNSSTGKYEATITAPTVTSYNVNSGHYYPITVEATNTAGTKTTVNDTTSGIGSSLQLVVKEKTKPTIAITSPGSGAFVTNSKQPIVFTLRDETNGSGIKITTVALKIDSGTAITSTSTGMVCTAVTGGYNCTYTPQTALSEGSHTVTINVSDNDGNSATQVSTTFKVDTVPPVLNVTSPTDNFITNNSSLVISGTTNDSTSSPVTVTVSLNGMDTGAVTVGTNGSFSKTVTLASGSNTIIVTSTDTAGKSSSVTLKGTLDTSAPTISAVSITPNPTDVGGSVIISVTVMG